MQGKSFVTVCFYLSFVVVPSDALPAASEERCLSNEDDEVGFLQTVVDKGSGTRQRSKEPGRSQITKSLATYVAPLSGPGAADNAAIKVWTPTGSGKFPVFMWIMGAYDEFDPYSVNMYDKFTEYMAGKGYISAIPEYSNKDACLNPCADAPCSLSLSQVAGKSTGAFSKLGNSEKVRGLKKALDVLCALPQADCSSGVAAAGHSHGAFLVVQLATDDTRISAISPWSYGYVNIWDKETCSCLTGAAIDKFIPKQKRRMVVGRFDDHNSLETTLDMQGPPVFSSYTCGGVHAPIDCIQSDGSGYYVIARTEYTEVDKAVTPMMNMAGHSFFFSTEHVLNYSKLVPSFESGSKPWHMKPIFDWLATAAKVKTLSAD